MQLTRLCIVNKTFCCGKKTSNFHKNRHWLQSSTKKYVYFKIQALSGQSHITVAKMKLLFYFAGLSRLQKDWMNKTNLCELQRVVKKMSTSIVLLMIWKRWNNETMIWKFSCSSFFIIYHAHFATSLTAQDSTHPANGRHSLNIKIVLTSFKVADMFHMKTHFQSLWNPLLLRYKFVHPGFNAC